LIEAEALEGLIRDYGIAISPGDSRRNVVTRNVPLNHLVDREFLIGNVRLRGTRLCEPCAHLEKLTERGALRGLVRRGGLRAEILSGGTIRVGDPITLPDD
jgi:MOSC domain-containing protein YiiM